MKSQTPFLTHIDFYKVTSEKIILPLTSNSTTAKSKPQMHSYHFFIIHHWSCGLTDRHEKLQAQGIWIQKCLEHLMIALQDRWTCVLSLSFSVLHQIWISFKLEINLEFLELQCHFRFISVRSFIQNDWCILSTPHWWYHVPLCSLKYKRGRHL